MLQIRILVFKINNPESVNTIDISVEVILISLGFALAHTIFEIIFVKLEAVACKTSLMHYSIICFNGRFGWVPFTNKFNSKTGKVATY